MNELVKIHKLDNGQDIVFARDLYNYLEVSERFGNWIERQFQYGFEENNDFVGCKVFNTLANQELDDYMLNMDCAKEISMLQRSEKGKLARQYFIAMEKLAVEKSKIMQLPDFNNPVVAARAWADEKEARQLAEAKNKELAPKADVYDQISNCHNLKSVGEVAKVIGTGRNRLYEWLRDIKVLMSNNLPYQSYVEQGYFEVKTAPIPQIGKDNSQTFFTVKGELWICERWRKAFLNCHKALNN